MKSLSSNNYMHKSFRGRLTSVSCASALALMWAGQAMAQEPAPAPAASASDDNGGLAEIVVTAQKRSENMQKVPIAITAVSPEIIQNAGIKSTQDLPVVLPGLQIVNIADSLVPRVRGVGSTFTAAGLENPVATFVDDVYRAFAADISLDFADVSQVAILKGPQGTLFGRNATGGVLQVTTRAPSFEFGGSAETSLDNYLTSRSNVFVTGGLSEKVAASLSLSYVTQGKGWGENLTTGHDQYKINHSFMGRGKFHILASDHMTIDLAGDYSDRSGNTSANFHQFPGKTAANPAPVPADPWDGTRAIDSRQDVKGGGVSAKVAQEFDFATLTSITAYRDSKIYYQFTPALTPTPLRNLYVHYGSKQFTQELQLVSPSSGPLTWTLGAFYFWNDATIQFNTDLFGPFATSFARQLIPAEQKTESLAGYAQATYKLADSTRLTAGFRYTWDKKTYDGRVIGVTAGGVNVPLVTALGKQQSAKKPTWRLALDHDFTPQVMGYLSYNRGFKSGGFNTTSPANPPFKPEVLDAYEAGIKSQWLGNRVRLNVGGFYYDYKNIQINIFTTGAPTVLNAAKSKIYGIDADLVARPTDELTFNASVNWLHARFKSFPNAPYAVTIAAGPLAGGAALINKPANGNDLPNSPNFTFSVGATYTVPVSDGKLSFNVNDSFNSGFYGEPDNQLHQKSYHIANASVAWSTENDAFTVRAFINNIFDKAVISQMFSAPWGYGADYTNPPLIVGGGVKVKF